MTNDPASDDLTVRLAGPGDAADLIGLLLAQLREHEIDTGRGGIAAVVDGMLADPRLGFLLVAAREGEAVGVACVSYSWTLEIGGRAAWLDELYVVPAARGAGIGRRLLHAAMAHAREGGCLAMELEVEESHRRAERLYEREGFRLHTRRRWQKRLG